MERRTAVMVPRDRSMWHQAPGKSKLIPRSKRSEFIDVQGKCPLAGAKSVVFFFFLSFCSFLHTCTKNEEENQRKTSESRRLEEPVRVSRISPSSCSHVLTGNTRTQPQPKHTWKRDAQGAIRHRYKHSYTRPRILSTCKK